MAEGFETRQVIESRSPTGGANQPARQLGLINVQAPRGGSIKDFGKGAEALAQAAKMGGQALDGYLKKKDAAEEIDIASRRQAGMTKAELIAEGGSESEIEKYAMLELKTGVDKFESGFVNSMPEHESKNPEDFNKELQKNYTDFFDNVGDIDDTALTVVKSLMVGTAERITESYTKAHDTFVKSKNLTTASNSLSASASTGNLEKIDKDVAVFYKHIAPGLGKEGTIKSMMGAMIPLLNTGNFGLLDANGGLAGLAEKGYSPTQLRSVSQAVDAAQLVRETNISALVEDRLNAIKSSVSNRKISLEEGEEQAIRVVQEQRLSPDYQRSLLRSLRDIDFKQDEIEDLNAIKDNPDATKDLGDILAFAAKHGNTEEVRTMLKSYSGKYSVPESMVQDIRAQIQAESNRQADMTVQSNRKHNQAVYEKEQQEKRAIVALSGGPEAIAALSKADQQVTLNIKIDSIASTTKIEMGDKVNPTPEIVKRSVEFLKTTNVISKRLQNKFETGASSSPLDKNGKLTEDAELVLLTVSEMLSQGIDPAKIKEYTGAENYAYYTLAAKLSGGSLDPTNGAVAAWDATKGNPDKGKGRFDPKAGAKAWFDYKKDLVSIVAPGVVSGIIGSDSDQLAWDQTIMSKLQEAVDSPEMERFVQERMTEYSIAFPGLEAKAVMSLVESDISRVGFVGDNAVLPDSSERSLKHNMGLELEQGAMIEQSAVYAYLFANPPPEGSDEREWFDSMSKLAGDKLNTLIHTPELFVLWDFDVTQKTREDMSKLIESNPSLNSMEPSKLLDLLIPTAKRTELIQGLSNINVRQLANGQSQIAIYKDNGDILEIRTVPTKDMGDLFTDQRRERKEKKYMTDRSTSFVDGIEKRSKENNAKNQQDHRDSLQEIKDQPETNRKALDRFKANKDANTIK